MRTEKKIDDMDYDELTKLKDEIETKIEGLEEEIKEEEYVLSYVTGKINKMDEDEYND